MKNEIDNQNKQFIVKSEGKIEIKPSYYVAVAFLVTSVCKITSYIIEGSGIKDLCFKLGSKLFNFNFKGSK
jgi:hypothetical protein